MNRLFLIYIMFLVNLLVIPRQTNAGTETNNANDLTTGVLQTETLSNGSKKTPVDKAIKYYNKADIYFKNKKYNSALKYYKKAVKHGNNAKACDQLGYMHCNGLGLKRRNYQEALRLFTISDVHGYMEAKYHLGVMHDNDWGIPQDQNKAIELFRITANNGIPKAQYMMGVLHYHGEGDIKKNYHEAFLWFQKVDQDKKSQYYMAIMHSKGWGVAINIKKSTQLYRQSAHQGYPYAQYEYAKILYFNEGVNKNLDQALIWFKKAAKQTLVMAQFKTALMYLKGEGTSLNLKRAYAWLTLTISTGNMLNKRNKYAVRARADAEVTILITTKAIRIKKLLKNSMQDSEITSAVIKGQQLIFKYLTSATTFDI